MSTAAPPGHAQFPDLADFVSGWLHQDFDIHGDTLEEIVDAYRRSVRDDYVQRLRDDLDRFLATADEDLDQRFQALFEPDIIPTAFRPTTREFLIAIRDGLRAGGP